MKYTALALLAATQATAQPIDQTAPAIQAILTQARAECAAEADPTGPKPELIVEPPAITWLDLEAEGEKNDAIVDFNHILCSATYSLWHGSGGSVIHLVRNGETSASWSGGLWTVVEFLATPSC